MIDDVTSDWLRMVACMPHGSYLGTLTFVILIDALRPLCMTHKFVDDTSMTKILNRSEISCMQSLVDGLIRMATKIGMVVNSRKTKEMFICSITKNSDT